MPLPEMPNPRQILARALYDGMSEELRINQVIEISGGTIAGLRPAEAADFIADGVPSFDLVAPGFIDLQINGAGDRQFNFEPSLDALKQIAAGARQGGTAYILPTYITAPGRDYISAIDAVEAAMEQGTPGILGLHLEGPFLSLGRPGIHDPTAIRALDEEDLERLAAARVGRLLLTVAPENLPAGSLPRLSAAGVRVFAGHSVATADQMVQAELEGLVGVTHLFNAMSQMTGREPGVVGAVFASKKLYAGIIADGHHVDWRNIAISARLMPDRLCLVTDAMLTLAGQLTKFDLHGEAIELNGGCLTNKTGRLAGAHVSLIECVRNGVEHAGLSLIEALRMVTANPAHALGLEGEVGRVLAGHRATFTCLTRDLGVEVVMVEGTFQALNRA